MMTDTSMDILDRAIFVTACVASFWIGHWRGQKNAQPKPRSSAVDGLYDSLSKLRGELRDLARLLGYEYRAERTSTKPAGWEQQHVSRMSIRDMRRTASVPPFGATLANSEDGKGFDTCDLATSTTYATASATADSRTAGTGWSIMRVGFKTYPARGGSADAKTSGAGSCAPSSAPKPKPGAGLSKASTRKGRMSSAKKRSRK